MDDQLADAADLRSRARAAGGAGNADAAVALLEEAAANLLVPYRACDRQSAPDDLEQRLAHELAETYGLLGGAHRRRGDLGRAIEAYDRGRPIESDHRYALDATYASLNWVVTSLLADPSRLGDPELTAELGRVRTVLEDRVGAESTFDAWAAGDIALAGALMGEPGRNAWQRFVERAPADAVKAYERIVTQLAGLDTPRRSALEEGLAELRSS